ncbi:hypothetical protein QBC35DRAFT_512201 [Podospora australis]|uniref:Nuclear GTPase SLIP-GC n=1 Tax=Podospora australis TaxID=1536484 RepID=A0AAN6X2L8_9PEZI|nr:hypothetical protein QBC35DRAFT_512201 [Podospora australis]
MDDSLNLDALARLARSDNFSLVKQGVDVEVSLLEDIKSALQACRGIPDVARILNEATELQKTAVPPRPVECLVPTNCMRVCTAVITEISYNDSEEVGKKYRAEIHFISKTEWLQELQILKTDLENDENATPDQETEAGVAYTKLRLVYPGFHKDELLRDGTTLEDFASRPPLDGLLGTVVEIDARTSASFLKQLKVYVDSKDKIDKPDSAKGTKDMEMWSLIKVVKLFVKAEALKTGLILVDLPGSGDSNPARNAIAAKYTDHSTRLWVVASIHRAVDEEVAQNLLGRSFQRQRELDGKYNDVTFICTKTDDLSVTEIMKEMSTSERAYYLSGERIACDNERASIEQQLIPIRTKMKETEEQFQECDRNIDALNQAIDTAEDDEDSVSVASPLKRKRSGHTAPVAKKDLQRDQDTDDADSSTTDEDDMEEVDVQTLSRTEALKQRREANFKKMALREEKKKLRHQMKPLNKRLKELKEKSKKLNSGIKTACIEYRNQYSRPTIQRQFAEGIRELDHENTIALDEEAFDPANDARDYDEVAAQLPVFCVSSRAYQILAGRQQKDDLLNGFENIEGTEIPALRRHCWEIVEKTNLAAYQKSLKQLDLFLGSLFLLVRAPGQSPPLAKELRAKNKEWHFTSSLRAVSNYLLGKTMEKLFLRLQTVGAKAFTEALATSTAWGLPRAEGGLSWTTYHAVCVREVSKRWKTTFDDMLPKFIDDLGKGLSRGINELITDLQGHGELKKAPTFSIAKELISGRQQEVTRLMMTTIMNEMHETYARCALETGTGTFRRMKEHMRIQLETNGESMFQLAADRARAALHLMMNEMEQELQRKTTTAADHADQDIRALVVNSDVLKAFKPVQQRVRGLINGTNRLFENIEQKGLEEIPGTPASALMDIDNHYSEDEAKEPTTPPEDFQMPVSSTSEAIVKMEDLHN